MLFSPKRQGWVNIARNITRKFRRKWAQKWLYPDTVTPPTGAGIHHRDGPKASHALTFKLDQSMGADLLRRALANAPAVIDVITSQKVVSSDAKNGLGFVADYQALTVWDEAERRHRGEWQG